MPHNHSGPESSPGSSPVTSPEQAEREHGNRSVARTPSWPCSDAWGSGEQSAVPGERLIFKNFCGKTWQEEQESENIYSRRTPPTAIVCPASHSPSGLCSSSAGQGPSHRLTCTMSNDKASLHSNGHGAPMSPHQELVLLFKISHNDRIDWEGTTSYFPRTLTSVTHTPRAHTPGQQLSKLGRIQAICVITPGLGQL